MIELLANKESSHSSLFGNLINTSIDFDITEEIELEQTFYEMIVGFWYKQEYYELLTPNSESNRNLRVYLPENRISKIEIDFSAKFYSIKKDDDRFDGELLSMNGVNLYSIRDLVVFEIAILLT